MESANCLFIKVRVRGVLKVAGDARIPYSRAIQAFSKTVYESMLDGASVLRSKSSIFLTCL